MTDFIRNLGRTVHASFTRPNDTTAYAVGDVVNDSTTSPTVLTFLNGTKDVGGFGILQSATIISGANQATKPDLQLFLFDTTVVAVNDNAAFAPTDTEMGTLLHVIAFPASSWIAGNATSGAGGNCVSNAQNLMLPVNTKMTGNAIFGVLVASAAYTPVAQETFKVRLGLFD